MTEPQAYDDAARPDRPSPPSPWRSEQSGDDTDRGWGEEPDDDLERLTRERPPHYRE